MKPFFEKHELLILVIAFLLMIILGAIRFGTFFPLPGW